MKTKRLVSIVLTFSILLGGFGYLGKTESIQASTDSPDIIVVLDPGHDGKHGGAESFGYQEHKLVYKIANYCREELEQYSGVKVYMTRTSNECPAGTKSSVDCNLWRVDYAKEVGADIYVSFHLDALERGTASGASIYYPNNNYRPLFGQQGKELATSILTELMNVGINKCKDGIKIRNSEDNSRYPDGSLADYLAVIKGAKLRGYPSVLIEHAYLTNRSDVNAYLNTEEKLKKIGIADATGIANYLGLTKETHVREAEDGNWYYYNGEEIDTTYTGLAKSETEWMYVKNGQVDTSVTSVIRYKDDWWYVKDGKLDTSYTGIGDNAHGSWYIENGKVDFSAHTVANGNGAWWYVKDGQVDYSYDGVGVNQDGTWYIEDGKVDFSKNGLYRRGDIWYLFSKGRVNQITTVEKNAHGWWYIENGQVNFSYDGVGTNQHGTWYIENGKVDFSKNGLYRRGDIWYLFSGGEVNKTTTVAKNVHGWWYVENGQVKFDYDGLGTNAHGTWYIKDGKVDFSYSGYIKIDGKKYKIKNGEVK